MKNIFTSIIAVTTFSIAAHAQPVLVSGFNGMASVNGTTYGRIGTVGDPTGGYAFVCASNDRLKFFGTSFSKRYLYFIDAATFNIVDSMNHEVYTISASNEPNTLFARINTGLARINTLTKTITDSVAIPGSQFVAERPNAKEVWVSSNNSIYVVDYTSSLTATPFTPSPVSTDNGDIRFTYGGTLAYKVAWTSKKVYKINAVTKTVLDSVITAPFSPSSIAVSRDSSRIYVTFPGDKKVRIYSTSSMAVIDSINCGTREPFDIYRHPDRAEIWVVNHFKDSITVFDEATNAQLAAFDVSSSPHSIAFGITSTAVNETGVSDANIAIWPNPAQQSITISGLETGDVVTLFDVTGRRWNAYKATQKYHVVDIAHLTPGPWFIRISDEKGNGKTCRQVIKQ